MYHIVKTKDGKNHTISAEGFDDICEVVKKNTAEMSLKKFYATV